MTHLVAVVGNDVLARRVIEEGLAEAALRMPLDVSSVCTRVHTHMHIWVHMQMRICMRLMSPGVPPA